MIGDLVRGSSEPGLGIDVINLGGFHEGEGDGHGYEPLRFYRRLFSSSQATLSSVFMFA